MRTLHAAVLLIIVGALAGCRFTTPDGAPLSLRGYDSVMIEEVRLSPGVSDDRVGPLLRGHTQVAVLESGRWKLAGEFDLDAFAALVEAYATVPHTIDGEAVGPVMTREEFIAEHAEANERRREMLAQPRGTRPVRVRMTVTELRFPGSFEHIAVGTKPRLRCAIEVYAGDAHLGGGTRESIRGLPGIPLLPGAMVSRAAKAVIFDELRRKTVLKLVSEMAAETVAALEQAG